MTTKKQWRVHYEVLYTGELTPALYTVDFIYFETVMIFLRNTEKHLNLISFTIERIIDNPYKP
jgi:hypothetical protein